MPIVQLCFKVSLDTRISRGFDAVLFVSLVFMGTLRIPTSKSSRRPWDRSLPQCKANVTSNQYVFAFYGRVTPFSSHTIMPLLIVSSHSSWYCGCTTLSRVVLSGAPLSPNTLPERWTRSAAGALRWSARPCTSSTAALHLGECLQSLSRCVPNGSSETGPTTPL